MQILNGFGSVTNRLVNLTWPVFLPVLIIASVYISVVTIRKVRTSARQSRGGRSGKLMGPIALSLGTKIGTGAIIGVLGSLSNLAGKGQGFIEGIALWGLVGSLVLVPLIYSETLISRMLDKSPVEYIDDNISRHAVFVYSASIVILHVFGFGGFQFSGIDAVAAIAVENFFGLEMTEIQRYVFVIIPVFLAVGSIVLAKKQDLFMNSISLLIGFAVVSYLSFFVIFFIRTSGYAGVFMARALEGMMNPVTMGMGLPVGFIYGLQRTMQCSGAGLGTSPMAADKSSDMGPGSAAIIQAASASLAVVLSLFITTYITSYGVESGNILFPSSGVERLSGFFNTATDMTGMYGMVSLTAFTLLSGMSILLGSYYFLIKVWGNDNENRNIAIYMFLVVAAGTLAVFGFDIVFDMVDILLFLVSGLNVYAVFKMVWNRRIYMASWELKDDAVKKEMNRINIDL